MEICCATCENVSGVRCKHKYIDSLKCRANKYCYYTAKKKSCDGCLNKIKYGMCSENKRSYCTVNGYISYVPIPEKERQKKEITELDKIRMNLYKDAYIESLKSMSPFPEGDIAGEFGRKAVERFDEFFNKENSNES